MVDYRSVPSWHIAMPPGGGVHSIGQRDPGASPGRRRRPCRRLLRSRCGAAAPPQTPPPDRRSGTRPPTARRHGRPTTEGTFPASSALAARLRRRRLSTPGPKPSIRRVAAIGQRSFELRQGVDPGVTKRSSPRRADTVQAHQGNEFRGNPGAVLVQARRGAVLNEVTQQSGKSLPDPRNPGQVGPGFDHLRQANGGSGGSPWPPSC